VIIFGFAAVLAALSREPIPAKNGEQYPNQAFYRGVLSRSGDGDDQSFAPGFVA
jgi:hypothetical protein